MAFSVANERAFLQAVSQLAYCNPFLPERTEFERAALGDDFVEGEPVWSLPVDEPERRAPMCGESPRAWSRWSSSSERGCAERRRREPKTSCCMKTPSCTCCISATMRASSTQFRSTDARARVAFLRRLSGGLASLLRSRKPSGSPRATNPCHTFACFRQIQRAFEQIFRDIIGGSMPAARLRAAVWQSIFTHDMRRYRRTLYARMGDFATLITGPPEPARSWRRAPSRNRATCRSTSAG